MEKRLTNEVGALVRLDRRITLLENQLLADVALWKARARELRAISDRHVIVLYMQSVSKKILERRSELQELRKLLPEIDPSQKTRRFQDVPSVIEGWSLSASKPKASQEPVTEEVRFGPTGPLMAGGQLVSRIEAKWIGDRAVRAMRAEKIEEQRLVNDLMDEALAKLDRDQRRDIIKAGFERRKGRVTKKRQLVFADPNEMPRQKS